MDQIFTRIAGRIAYWAGQPITFVLAASLIVVWGVCGPPFHYSDTWQLVVNTSRSGEWIGRRGAPGSSSATISIEWLPRRPGCC